MIANAVSKIMQRTALRVLARVPLLRGPDGPVTDSLAVDFLPAALAVQKRPPSPMGRSLMWVLIALFSFAVAWAMLGKVDIVAVAQGKIIPTGKSKTIQALETRAVVELPVRDGDAVKQGQVLLRLDDSEARSQWQQLQSQWQASQAAQWRLQSMLIILETKTLTGGANPRPQQLPEPLMAAEQAVLDSQLAALRSELHTLDMQSREREAELLSTQAQLHKWALQLPLATERANSRKALLAIKLVAQDAWRELEQQRINIAQSLIEAQARATQLQAALEKSQAQHQQLLAQRGETAQSELQAAEQRLSQLEQQLSAAKSRLDAHVLRAPVDGVVQQLAVHAIGAVVTPAQPVMLLVPAGQMLEVEAQLLNRDKGFVKVGHEAVVKIESFPFTRYGAIDGTITSISSDAVQDPQGQWLYTAKVSLAKSSILVEGEPVQLSPGMNVTVEVKTGTRRLIEFVLAPLMRAKDESVRER